jgi:hypothetical protein
METRNMEEEEVRAIPIAGVHPYTPSVGRPQEIMMGDVAGKATGLKTRHYWLALRARNTG